MAHSLDAVAPAPGGALARREARLPAWRRARRGAFYGAVRGLAGLVRALPRPAARALLSELGALAWATRRGDRATALRQLEIALPDLTEEERRATGRRSLQTLGRNLADTIHGVRALAPPPEERAALRAAQARGRGLLVVTGHLGAWELAGPVLAEIAGPIAAVTANPHNARVDAWLRRWRESGGVRSFDRSRESLAAARWLKRGGSLALLADHRSAVASTPAPWFGRVAPTAVGPARLARWTGAPVVVIAVRAEGDAHRLVVGPTLEIGVEESDPAFLARINRALEAEILAQPEAWTWWHDRYGREGERR